MEAEESFGQRNEEKIRVNKGTRNIFSASKIIGGRE